MNVCVGTNHLVWNSTLGGHAWVFLNWAFGLKANGCKITFLETLRRKLSAQQIDERIAAFCGLLDELGLEAEVTLVISKEHEADIEEQGGITDPRFRPFEEVAERSELFLNFLYSLPAEAIARFERSALIDIDPGLLQCWMSSDQIRPADHDLYFSIGETVGQPEARFEDGGRSWLYTPPPVALEAWTVCPPPAPGARYTTVTNWCGEYEILNGAMVNNEKRTHFVEYLEFPKRSGLPLEIAIYSEPGHPSEIPRMREHGFAARPAHEISSSALDYREYIRASRGEWSCAKPSCMVLANAWVSDRTLCYLASGRPALVQHTGSSRFLPDDEGLLRFHSLEDAVRLARDLEERYEHHAHAARALTEEHFDSAKVVRALLEKALSPRLSSKTN